MAVQPFSSRSARMGLEGIVSKLNPASVAVRREREEEWR
jgi:hypothetical protein